MAAALAAQEGCEGKGAVGVAPHGRGLRRGRWYRLAGAAKVLSAFALAVGLVPCLPSAAIASISVDLQARPVAVAIGEVISVTVTVGGTSGGVSEPQIAGTEAFDVYSAGRSTNISFVNGRISQSVTFSYQMVAKKEGTFTLGPAVIEKGGRSYSSRTVEITVTKASSQPSPQTGRSTPRRSESLRGVPPDGLFARLVVDRKEAYVDQQVIVRFRLYQRHDVDLREIGGFQEPSMEGFWREDLGPQRDYDVEIDGKLYRVRELSWALFPTRDGDLQIGPASVECAVAVRKRRRRDFFSDFFGSPFYDVVRKTVRAKAVTIHVKPLPEKGRPAEFTGSVGEYEVAISSDSKRLKQGEPVAVTVTISGRGHIQTVGEPIWPELSDFRTFDSGEAVSVDKSGGIVEGKKEYTRVLIPNRAGRLSIGPVVFCYFDPQKGQYVQKQTSPLGLEVLPAETGTAGLLAGPGEGHLSSDILYIHTQLPGDLSRPAGPGAGMLVNLLPLVLVAIALVIRNRREELARNPLLVRRSAALKRALAALKDLEQISRNDAPRTASGLARALEGFLSDWMGEEVSGLRRSALAGRLEDAGMNADLRSSVLEMLAWCDEARFGAGAHPEDVARKPAELRELLRRLDREFRRLLGKAGRSPRGGRAAQRTGLLVVVYCLFGVSAWAAMLPHSVVETWKEATSAYEQGDYQRARLLYERLIEAGWRSPYLWYNLGNAAFRAGERGWAVAYLEQARRLAPRDAEILHNLRIVRAGLGGEEAADAGSSALGAMASLMDAVSAWDCVRLLLAAVWLVCLLLAARLLLPVRLRGVASGGLRFSLGVLLLAAALLGAKAYQRASAPNAVVVCRRVEVRSGPRDTETVQFALDEGTMLHAGRGSGSWREVWLGPDARGWAPDSCLTLLEMPPLIR